MMNTKKISIVFFGTPDFAVSALDILVSHKYTIKAVVTNTDKPAGRKLQLLPSDVKKYAIEKGLPILQPLSLNDHLFIDSLRKINPDLMVVIAFKKLPKSVWSIPRLGTINIHPSLLPNYRGAAPLNWALINGEKQTGVSIIKINDKIDSGDILSQIKIDISPDMNVGELHDKLKLLGAELLVKTIDDIVNGNEQTIPQQHIKSEKKAPKIHKDDCLLSFEESSDNIVNKVRGLSPYPAAYIILNGKHVKIFRARKGEFFVEDNLPKGSLHTDHKTFLKIRCQDGYVYIDDLQAEGKKRMSISNFLRGWR